eukprot:SAG31_NODE_14502_length_803_cov_0.948864_1_plen_165_part_00
MIVGPLKDLAGNHNENVVVANGPGTMIQLRQNTKYKGRIVSSERFVATFICRKRIVFITICAAAGYTLEKDSPGESGAQLPYYTDDSESTWPRKFAQQDYVPFLDESQLVELSDNAILMLSRNYRNCSLARTNDGKPLWWSYGQGICAAITRSTDGARKQQFFI